MLHLRHSCRVFSGVRVPLLIIENHCNPISSPRGWRDVKSRRSRLRSFHPNESTKPRYRPIRRYRGGVTITRPRRVQDPSPSGTNRTDVDIHRNPSSPYGNPRVTVHCETRVVDLFTSLYYASTDEDVVCDEVFTA